MNFNFDNPVKIITGESCVSNHADEFLKLGKSCLIITSKTAAKKSGALTDVTQALDELGIKHMLFDDIEQNPSVESCVQAGSLARMYKHDFIVGVGGGSPLDAAKAAAVYAVNEMDDNLDIYKNDWPVTALPIAAVGTTAGTGSEVTCFSILTMPNGRKKSFGKHDTYPVVMFGDAVYTKSLPLDFTKSTALDALSHALEAYFNMAANDLTDMFAIEAVSVLCPQLQLLGKAKTAEDITPAQRERLYYASIVAGLALSHCGTLYCHNLSYFFTENHHVPHGFACAATLPDLVKRGEKYASVKADRMFRIANTSADGLCKLIESVRILPEIKLKGDVIRRLAREGVLTKNFAKTVPNGFSSGDAIALLTQLCGE